MDLATLNSRAAAQSPGRLHIKHPATGEDLYADKEMTKPMIFLVIGSDAPEAQRATRELQKGFMRQGKDDNTPSADMHGRLVKLAAPLVVGFENVIFHGKEARAPEDVIPILSLEGTISMRPEQNSFAEQTMTFASDRTNYLGNVSGA